MRFPRSLLLGAVVLGLGLAGCRPAGYPAGTDALLRAGTTVHFRIRPEGFGTEALPVTDSQISYYLVTLYRPGNVPVTGITNPVRIDSPAAMGSFTGVTDGTGYSLTIEAFDATDASLTRGGPVTATNTFSVAGGVVTDSAGRAVTFTLPL